MHRKGTKYKQNSEWIASNLIKQLPTATKISFSKMQLF